MDVCQMTTPSFLAIFRWYSKTIGWLSSYSHQPNQNNLNTHMAHAKTKSDILRDKIIAALAKGGSFTVADLVKATGTKAPIIHKHTSELVKTGVINRAGHGIFEAVAPPKTDAPKLEPIPSPSQPAGNAEPTAGTTKELIVKALNDSMSKKLTTQELIKLTGRTPAAINTATSEMVRLQQLKRIQPGLFELGVVALPSASTTRKPRTARDPNAPQTTFKTRRNRRTVSWLEFLPAILKEMVGIEIMENPTGDRSRLGMFHEAERRVLTHKGKPELIRAPISFTNAVEDFGTRYEAARITALEELITTPPPDQIPVGDVTLISDEVLFAAAISRFLGVATTLAALPANIQRVLSGIVKPAEVVHAPPAAEKPTKRVPHVALVGLHELQHRYILDYPPVKKRIEGGSLKLEFATKSRASLELKHSGLDGVIILPGQVGMNVVQAAHQKFPPTGTAPHQQDNVIEVHGIGAMRESLIEYVMRLEKKYGWQ